MVEDRIEECCDPWTAESAVPHSRARVFRVAFWLIGMALAVVTVWIVSYSANEEPFYGIRQLEALAQVGGSSVVAVLWLEWLIGGVVLIRFRLIHKACLLLICPCVLAIPLLLFCAYAYFHDVAIALAGEIPQ